MIIKGIDFFKHVMKKGHDVCFFLLRESMSDLNMVRMCMNVSAKMSHGNRPFATWDEE